MYYILYMYIHKYIYIYRPSSLTRVQKCQGSRSDPQAPSGKIDRQNLGTFQWGKSWAFHQDICRGDMVSPIYLWDFMVFEWYFNGI